MKTSIYDFLSFMEFALIIRSLVHSEFVFVYAVRKESNFILLYVDIQLFIWWKDCFPLLNCLSTFFKNQLDHKYEDCFWTHNLFLFFCVCYGKLNWFCSPVSFLFCLLILYRNIINFVHYSCVLQLCWIHILVLIFS